MTRLRAVFPVRIDGKTVAAWPCDSGRGAPVQIVDVLADPDYGAKDAARLAGFRANTGRCRCCARATFIGTINVCRARGRTVRRQAGRSCSRPSPTRP